MSRPMTEMQWEELFRTAVPVWVEDDAAPDAEGLGQALQRIWPHFQKPADPVWSMDYGDCFDKIYEYGKIYICCQCSYRGNNLIKVANR